MDPLSDKGLAESNSSTTNYRVKLISLKSIVLELEFSMNNKQTPTPWFTSSSKSREVHGDLAAGTSLLVLVSTLLLDRHPEMRIVFEMHYQSLNLVATRYFICQCCSYTKGRCFPCTASNRTPCNSSTCDSICAESNSSCSNYFSSCKRTSTNSLLKKNTCSASC